MSEPQEGAGHSFWKWVERIVWLLAGLGALAAILVFLLEYQLVKKERYEKLVGLEGRVDREELIAPEACPNPECPPPASGPEDPGVDQVTILTTALDELIDEAGFLTRYIGKPEFFERFDRWRTKARNKLADGQKLIKDAGWTSNEDWAGTFRAQTHINREVTQEPYRPEEYRRFLESGSRVLERMKREVILHSGRGNPPAGGSSSAPLTPDS